MKMTQLTESLASSLRGCRVQPLKKISIDRVQDLGSVERHSSDSVRRPVDYNRVDRDTSTVFCAAILV